MKSKPIKKERYTLENLRAQNESYDREYHVTLYDVNKANFYVGYIENTRSESTPKVGDRIILTTKFGDYYQNAHIAKLYDYGFSVCEFPSIPYIYLSDKGFSFDNSGGSWIKIKPEKLVYVGTDTKTFCTWGHCGLSGVGVYNFDAEVSVWEYKEAGSLYGDFTTKDWRRIYVYELDDKEKEECEFDFYAFGFAWRNKQELNAFIKKYKGTVFPGSTEKNIVVWCYSEESDYLPIDKWNQLDLPICTEHKSRKGLAKIKVDDEKHIVYNYYAKSAN